MTLYVVGLLFICTNKYFDMRTKQKRRSNDEIWVKGLYKEEVFVGRTFIDNDIDFISLITESGMQMIVPFNSISGIVKLEFVKQMSPKISTNIRLKKNHSKIEKLILKTLESINQNS